MKTGFIIDYVFSGNRLFKSDQKRRIYTIFMARNNVCYCHCHCRKSRENPIVVLHRLRDSNNWLMAILRVCVCQRS